LENVSELRRALDFFYPGRLAILVQFEERKLKPTPLRATLERQSGIYRVAAKLTDAQANTLIANFCRSDGGCLRTILWKRDSLGTIPSTNLPATKFDPSHDQTGKGEQCISLLCQEACNLLVNAARKTVKDSS
jgi:sirohydrochlorin cobaltochelatase